MSRIEIRTDRFRVPVNIVHSGAYVWVFIVRDVVDLVFIQEVLSDYPRRLRDDFVDPAAVADGFASKQLHV